MKKIISFIATVAMVSSLFVTAVRADFTPTVTSVVGAAVSNADFYDYFDEDIPDGYTVYPVTLSLSDLGDLSCAISAKKHTGRKIQSFSYEMKFSDVSKVETDYTLAYDSVLAGLSEGFVSDTYRVIFNAGSASAAYPTTAGTISGSIDDALTVWVLVATGESITATVNATFNVVTYAKDVPGTEEPVNFASMSPASISFGASAPEPKPVTGVTISGATSATVGDNVQLAATVEPSDADDPSVTWALVSGNGAVSATGVVTATAAGDVVVSATAGSITANYTVTFAAATVPATSVTIDGPAKAVVGESATFTATVAPPETTDTVVWDVTGGASVDNGVVTASAAGKYTVTATAGSVSASKDIDFIAAPAAPTFEANTYAAADKGSEGNYIHVSRAQVTAPDFTNFVYNVWARDDENNEAILGTINSKVNAAEISGAFKFILMVKSATHKIVETGITPALK